VTSLASDFANAIEEVVTKRKRREVEGSDFVRRYFNDPVAFSTELFEWPAGRSIYPYQERYFREVVDARRVAVRGPHGYGKTAGDAMLIWWFAVTREAAGIPWKVVTTAGGDRQLRRYLWPEIHLWRSKLRDVPGVATLRLLTQEIQGRYGLAFGASVTNPALIEGAHAAQLLFVFDEAKSIPGSVFDAAEGALSNDRGSGGEEAIAIATSTPGDEAGRFYEIHQRRKGLEDWRPFRVTKEEMIAAGRMSQAWADQRRAQWGEKSILYQTKVEGNFAKSSGARNVIPLSAVEAAVDRWNDWRDSGSKLEDAREVWGVDVGLGGIGRDPAARAIRRGDVITSVEVLPELRDHNELVGLLAPDARRRRVTVVADAINASGFIGRLREVAKEDFSVIAFNAGGKSEAKDETGELSFVNLRAEMWWGAREWLMPQGSVADSSAALPEDDTLTGELTTPEWWSTSSGKIQVEAKEDIARRLRSREDREDEGGSTNRADAVLMARMDHLGSGARDAVVSFGLRGGPRRGVF